MAKPSLNNCKKYNVAIILGGQSPEHTISINSGCSLLNNVDREAFHIHPIYIDINGRWWQYPQQNQYQPEDFTINIAESVANRCIIMPDEEYQLVRLPNLEKIDCDVCFSIVHGTTGEDGKLQGLFEVANLPYVGSDVAASSIAMNKVIMKDILNANNIPTADYITIEKHSWKDNPELFLDNAQNLKLPIFVKPANTGSSVGISKVDSYKDLKPAILTAFKFDSQVLVEEGIYPARELEMAVLGNHDLQVSCIGEIDPPDGFYDYASKYLNNTAALYYPAEVNIEIEEKMRNIAIETYKVLGLKGLSRIDFLLEESTNEPYIIEVNTLPGFTNISMYPKLWQVSGKPYLQLITDLIYLAMQAHEEKKQRQVDFSNELIELQNQS